MNLKLLLCILVANAGILSTAKAVIQADGQKIPNIVILYADDMGAADVSYGDNEASIQTPNNIDRLADQGMIFTDGHSSSGVCLPSRFECLRDSTIGIVSIKLLNRMKNLSLLWANL